MRLVLVLVIAFSMSALASQTNPTREELLQTVQHISKLAKEQQTELDEAHANESSLDTNLKGALKELGKAQGQLVDLQTEILKLAQHDANETAAKKHILHKYHILKAIACAIAAAVAIFVVMRLTSFIPMAIMPYKIYLYAGVGVAAATAVAVFL